MKLCVDRRPCCVFVFQCLVTCVYFNVLVPPWRLVGSAAAGWLTLVYVRTLCKICTYSDASYFSFSNLLNRFLVNVMCGVLFVLPLSCAVTLYINESQRRWDINFSSRLFEIYVNLSVERRPRAGRRNKMFHISANLKNLHICTCCTHRVSIYTIRVISWLGCMYLGWISCWE